MFVLHISYTPLAGAPIRIVNALNKHTAIKARLVNLSPNEYGARTFPEDIIFVDNKEFSELLVSKADIIVAHHPIDLCKNKFGINFKDIAKSSCKFIQHFHSNYYSYKMQFPCLNGYDAYCVIPHYPERSFLGLEILPNIIPINDNELVPSHRHNIIPKVVFSASIRNKRFSSRWGTKGYYEVSRKMKKLSKKYGFEYSEIFDIPYHEAMKIKQESDIVIGDIVTGSYHLTELEGLSMGKCVFCNLDGRSIQTLISEFKCKDIPFVNVSIDELDDVLYQVINKKLYEQIGEFSRNWIEKYYNDAHLIQRHVNFYNKVINSQDTSRENSTFYPDVKSFLYKDVYDIIWNSKRKKREPLLTRLIGKKLKY